MKKLKFLVSSFIFLASIFSHAAGELAGTYDGNEWGYFSWGDPCTVQVNYQEISRNDEVYSSYEILFPAKQGLNVSRGASEIDPLLSNKATKTIRFQQGSRWSEGDSKEGGHLKLKNGKLSQVYLWDAYLFLPATGFTCGNLKKR